MTHTEESLMALVSGFVQASCDRGFILDVTWDDVRQQEKALRLAIREVLAELANAHGVAQACEARAEKAEAELALLKDDNAKWKAGILNMPMKYKRMEFNAQLQRQVERAEAECERLRKDAERYRWLREQKWDTKCAACWAASAEETDAAIDAYLAKVKR